MPTVLIAEDDRSVRAVLEELVSSDERLECIASVEDAEAAIDVARTALPDIALLDVKMPRGGGIRAARGIRTVSPDTRIIALSAYRNRATIVEMLRAGAVGYLVKGTPAADISRAIRQVADDRGTASVSVSPDVIAEIAKLLDDYDVANQKLRELNAVLEDAGRKRAEWFQAIAVELLGPMYQARRLEVSLSSDRDGADTTSSDELHFLAERIGRVVSHLEAASTLPEHPAPARTGATRALEIVSAAIAGIAGARDRLRLANGEELERWFVAGDVRRTTYALRTLFECLLECSATGSVVVRRDEGSLILDASDAPRSEFAGQRSPAVPDEQLRRRLGHGLGFRLAAEILDVEGGSIDVEVETTTRKTLRVGLATAGGPA